MTSASRHPRQGLATRTLATTLALLQALPLGLTGLMSPIAQAYAQTPPTPAPIQYNYDAQGNLTKVIDPNGLATDFEPDSLHRTRKQTLPAPVAGTARPVVQYGWDGLDRLTRVTDPRNTTTFYIRSGLLDVAQVSPDTGVTFHFHDAGGSLNQRTNARSQSMSVMNTDTLGRPTLIGYTDDTSTAALYTGYTSLGYDAYSTTAGAENYGRGHLTLALELDGNFAPIASTSLRYDIFGHLTRRCQFWQGASAGSYGACTDGDALRYRWNTTPGSASTGRLVGLTYPSGRKVDYQYDAQGRIQAITTEVSVTEFEPEGNRP